MDGDATETIDGKVTIGAAELFGAAFGKGRLEADKISVVVGGELLLSLEKNGTLGRIGSSCRRRTTSTPTKSGWD